MTLTPDQIRARLEKALHLGGDEHTVEELIEDVRARKAQCLHNDQAIVFTQVEQHRNHRVLRVYVAAGDMDAVLSLQPQAVDLARKEGCDRLVMTGRKGWAWVLPKRGWRERYITYELPLAEG